MTIPAFGRCTPIQMSVLSLAGYDLTEFDPTFVTDEQDRLALMRRGRRQLVELTGQDYRFHLHLWREYLVAYGAETGYTHPYAYKNMDRAVQTTINDEKFKRLSEQAEAGGDEGVRPCS